jgi:predicted DNA-binding protein
MVKTAAISLRVSPELKESLEQQATADGRSLASYVERVLTLHVNNMFAHPETRAKAQQDHVARVESLKDQIISGRARRRVKPHSIGRRKPGSKSGH